MSSALPLPSEETLKAIADHRQEYFKGWKLCDSTTAQSAPAAHGQALMNGAATNGCGSSASRNEAEAAQPSTSTDAAGGIDSSQDTTTTEGSSSHRQPSEEDGAADAKPSMADHDNHSRRQPEGATTSRPIDNVSVVANGEGYLAINCVHEGRTYTGILLADGRDGFPGTFSDEARTNFASQCAYDKQGHPFDQWTSCVDDRQVQAPRPKRLCKTNFAKSGGRMLCYYCLQKVPKEDPGYFGCICKERQKNRLAMKKMRNRQQRDRTTVVAQLSGFDEPVSNSGASSPPRPAQNGRAPPRKRKASSDESSPALTRSQSIDYTEHPDELRILLGTIFGATEQVSPSGNGASRRKMPKTAVRRTPLEDCTVPISKEKAGTSAAGGKKPVPASDSKGAPNTSKPPVNGATSTASPTRPTSMAVAVQSPKPTSVVKPRVQTPSNGSPRASTSTKPSPIATTSAAAAPSRPSMSGMPPSASRLLTAGPPVTPEAPGSSSPSGSPGDAQKYTVKTSEKPLHLTLVKVSPAASSNGSATDTTPMVSPVPKVELPKFFQNGKFTINIGDVVWARAPPCAFWPGMVIDIVSETECAINWIGEKTHSVVLWANVESFQEQFGTRFLRNDNKDKYCASIAEAIARAKVPAAYLNRKASFKVASILVKKYGYDMHGLLVCKGGKFAPYRMPPPPANAKPSVKRAYQAALARTQSSSSRDSSVLNASASADFKDEPMEEEEPEEHPASVSLPLDGDSSVEAEEAGGQGNLTVNDAEEASEGARHEEEGEGADFEQRDEPSSVIEEEEDSEAGFAHSHTLGSSSQDTDVSGSA